MSCSTPSLPTSTSTTWTASALNDLPLDELLEMDVASLPPEGQMAFVQRCALLRSSAQTRKATLVKEGVEKLGVKKKTAKKDSVSMAMAYLSQIK